MAGNNLVVTEFAQQLITQIKAEQELMVRTRPVLGGFSIRMPIGIMRQLKKAAKKHGVTQTDIVLRGLRSVLPVLLSEEEQQRELALDVSEQ